MSDPIVDLHCHPLFPAYTRLLAGDTHSSGSEVVIDGMPLPPWSFERLIETMDQNGISASVLSLPELSNILVGPEGRAEARAMNEELAALVTRRPSRLGALAVLPLDDMEAANDEMAYALDVLKLDGVCVSTNQGGKYLGEPQFEPWFEEMNRRGVALFVHPTKPATFDVEASSLNVAVLDFMFETTRMVTHMVLSGTKQRFDKIRIIAAHSGGTIPFLAHRISLAGTMPWAYRDGPKLDSEQIRAALASFYFELTASMAPASLDAIRSFVSADRLMLGFDYPLMPPQTIPPALKAFAGYAGFEESDKRKIRHETALQLFPRLAVAIR